jgi:hypothetical protein
VIAPYGMNFEELIPKLGKLLEDKGHLRLQGRGRVTLDAWRYNSRFRPNSKKPFYELLTGNPFSISKADYEDLRFSVRNRRAADAKARAAHLAAEGKKAKKCHSPLA